MATNEITPTMTTSQVITNFNGPPTLTGTTPDSPGAPGSDLGPEGAVPGTSTDPIEGIGIEGEEVVWEGCYALRNFLGRLVILSALSLGWVALATYTWGLSDGRLGPLTAIAGIVLAGFWLSMGYRIMVARYGHSYRLTTRRLFVSTGFMRRRRDMMELLRVKDVFTRQSFLDRWLSLGTVVVVSSDTDMPTYYLAGVENPKHVMDLVWHHARAERDQRSVKIESV